MNRKLQKVSQRYKQITGFQQPDDGPPHRVDRHTRFNLLTSTMSGWRGKLNASIFNNPQDFFAVNFQHVDSRRKIRQVNGVVNKLTIG